MGMSILGDRGYHKELVAATISLTPPSDRAAVVHRIAVTNASAADTWILTCGNAELARFREETDGNQQLLGSNTTNYPRTEDIFRYYKFVTGNDLTFPVPQGDTLTLASVGGATADLYIEYEEVSPAIISPNMPNHPAGARHIIPWYASHAASVTGAGDLPFDTEIKTLGMPALFTDANMAAGWNVKIIGLFMEAAGVNTYDSSADHQSVTDHLALQLGNRTMFTRDLGDGIPVVGSPSATGSANTVYDSVLNALPPFQKSRAIDWEYFDPPLFIATGQSSIWRLNVTGDVTGGADYSKVWLAALVDITSGIGQA